MPEATQAAKAPRRAWIGLGVIALPCVLYAMDLTVLNLAVPHLTADLSPSASELLWIVDIYGFMIAGTLITMGTLGDRIGRHRLLLIGAAVSGIASVFAAFATSPGMLIAARALLGLAAKASGAEEIFAQLLREDAGASLDMAVLSDVAATDESPAGLLNGVTPLTAATGGGTAAMEADLEALAGAVAAAGGSGSVAFVMNPLQAAAVAIRKPDLKLPVWPTRALAAGTVVALDPTAFVSGFGAVPDICTSEQATLHMEDANPLDIGTPPATVAAPTSNMFQTRQIATRIIADVAFTMRGDGLVQVVEDVTW